MSKTMKPMHINIPISKIDEEKRMVWGYATVEEIDKHGEIIGYEASKTAFAAWPGNIREMHGDKAVGKGIEVEFDDKNKGVWLGAYVSESADGENAWIKVKEKILNGFSIGGRINDWTTTKQKVEGEEKDVVMITDYDLSEVSLVDNPACPSAVFQMVKSAGGKLVHTEKMQERGGIPQFWFEKAYAIEPRQFITKSNSHYNKDSMGKASDKTIEKGIWSAYELVSLGGRLADYIWCEEFEGKDAGSLKNALEEIKAAAAQELGEPEKWPEPMSAAIDLAMQTLGITKADLEAKKMSDAKDTKKSVTGDEDRDANAEVVTTAEENGRPENDTKERADAAGVAEGEGANASDGNEVVTDNENAGDKGKDTEDAKANDSGDGEDEGKETPKKPKKSDDASDLSKSTSQNDLVKAFGEQVQTIVKEAVAPLEERLGKLESQPAPSKAKAGYAEVEKSEKVETEQSKLQDELADIMKRADELAENPNASTQAERVRLATRARVIQRMLDPASVAQHATIKAQFSK